MPGSYNATTPMAVALSGTNVSARRDNRRWLARSGACSRDVQGRQCYAGRRSAAARFAASGATPLASCLQASSARSRAPASLKLPGRPKTEPVLTLADLVAQLPRGVVRQLLVVLFAARHHHQHQSAHRLITTIAIATRCGTHQRFNALLRERPARHFF